MSDEVTVAIAGICGYGAQYVNELLTAEWDGFRWVAAIARRPHRSERLSEIKERGVELYHDLDEFYSRSTADLVIITSPIQLHREHSCLALDKGSSVLCEKPVAATVQDALAMSEKAKASKGFCAIGYQWSFASAIQELKKDILAGDYGRPVRMKTLVNWARNKAYYGRNDWAGALRNPAGDWVLDSPLANATAHFLHNIFYILGKSAGTSAWPVQLQAELYRANEVENYDTAALRCETEDGVEALYYTSHAIPSSIGPVITYEFENGVVYFEESRHGKMIGRLPNGELRHYGNPSLEPWSKIWQCIDAVRTGSPVVCDVDASTPLTLAVNGAQDSMPEVVSFERSMLAEIPHENDPLVWIKRLQQSFVQCFGQGILPSEHGGLGWARPGKMVDLSDYEWFPGGVRPSEAGSA